MARQIELLDAGERVRQQTRHWDEASGRTLPGRDKENSEDYRYFPEPDLVPVVPDPAWVERGAGRAAAAARRPAGPTGRAPRVSPASTRPSPSPSRGASTTWRSPTIAAGADAARTLTHLEHNLAGEGAELVRPERLAALIGLETGGQLTATQTKAVLADLVAAGGDADPAALAEARGFAAMDADDLAGVVDGLLAAFPAEWQRFVEGDPKTRGKLTGHFVGQVMKATSGKADGKAVTALLKRRAPPRPPAPDRPGAAAELVAQRPGAGSQRAGVEDAEPGAVAGDEAVDLEAAQDPPDPGLRPADLRRQAGAAAVGGHVGPSVAVPLRLGQQPARHPHGQVVEDQRRSLVGGLAHQRGQAAQQALGQIRGPPGTPAARRGRPRRPPWTARAPPPTPSASHRRTPTAPRTTRWATARPASIPPRPRR